MSLKVFHLFFISLSILLSAYFAGWGFREYQLMQGNTELAYGIFGVICVLSLTVYLAWFLKKSRGFGYLLLALMLNLSLGSVDAWACAVCVGNPKAPMVQAANAGVLFMLGIIGSVLASLVGVFGYWAMRIKKRASAAF